MKKKKILIIDDEEDFILVEKCRLETAGYEVISSTTGHDGIQMAMEQKPDLIILDIMMPQVSGYQVCFYLKSVKKLNMPIMMLTAMGFKKDISQADELGADDYMTKPYDPAEFLKRVAKLLSKK